MLDEKIRPTDWIKPPVIVRSMYPIEQQCNTGHIEIQAGLSDKFRPSRCCLEHSQATKNKAKLAREYLLVAGKVGSRCPEQGAG
jgi:hypothetical protein